MPNITRPQKKVMDERKTRAPILRVRMVAGGWKTVYVVKKTSVMMFWSVQPGLPRESACQSKQPILLTYRFPTNMSSSPMLQGESQHSLRRTLLSDDGERSEASPSDDRIAQISTIEQTDAVHQADSGDQAIVDTTHDALLLGESEAFGAIVVTVVDPDFGGAVAVGLLQLTGHDVGAARERHEGRARFA